MFFKQGEKHENIHKLSFITKAAFFSEIQQLIHTHFDEKSIEIFAVPLSYFDWNLSEGLKSE